MAHNFSNDRFLLAADIINNTSQSVFLTGKAGTGKTTFLRHISETSDKNLIIAAPTGVAAINAGGVTLHSLFQLPFEPFIPNLEGKQKLEQHIKLRKSKIEMLRELELLIIDEVSMLRVDMLDAIDVILRRYRNNNEPFGGVQMLYIGDMFQLPPVVQPQEWALMGEYYPTPFFFHAQALNNNLPLYIELKQIYRQTDRTFIELLDKVRHNSLLSTDIDTLNERYDPSFQLSGSDKYVVLTTHNSKADKINRDELAKLNGKEVSFQGYVKGDFSENAFPADLNLCLKVGAQVMFVKNDIGNKRRYYNGKLATISRIEKDKIYVVFEDSSELLIEQDIWRNVRYTLNADTGKIEEDELGYFKQYPIRLAWAITIHKSQGLTFDRVVIDAGSAFAAGQVYVALSRCTSLGGIVLFSKITLDIILTDEEIVRFSKSEKSDEYLHKCLLDEKAVYCANRFRKSFDFSPIVNLVSSFYDLVGSKKLPNQEEVLQLAVSMKEHAFTLDVVGKNFQKELDLILNNTDVNFSHLQDRTGRAVLYFHKQINNQIVQPLNNHLNKLKNASKVKLYLKEANQILTNLISFLEKLECVHYADIPITTGLAFENLCFETGEPANKDVKLDKPKKGDSQLLSLSMYQAGKSIDQIASERNLSRTTIETHLSNFIATGDISALEFVTQEKIDHITSILPTIEEPRTLTSIKEKLGDNYSYFEIKVVLGLEKLEKFGY